jgi:hypothetical protein
MSKLSKRHFWEWFKRNNKEYLDLNNKSKKEATYWLNELNTHLRAYYKFFEYSVSLPNDGKGLPKLTVTVNGRAMHFKKVDDFVATAPEIPGWQIGALEDPMPIDFLMEKHIESTGIHPGEFFFSFASDDPDDTSLIMYHPLCSPHNVTNYLQVAYPAVYNLLGERTYGLEINHIGMENLSEADPDDVYPLEELPIHIALRKPTMVVGPNGTLQGMD